MTADTNKPLLSVRGLTLDIPLSSGTLHAVRGIDFDLYRGKTLCIVGESGSGKSLTSLAIMGLLDKNIKRRAERMEFGGIELTKASNRQMRSLRGNRIAMIFQEPMTSLNPAYTIGDQLIEALACFVLAATGAGRFAGLDFFLHLIVRKIAGPREAAAAA